MPEVMDQFNSYYYLLYRNIDQIHTFLDELQKRTKKDIDKQLNSIKNNNIQNLVLAIILITASFGLIIPSFYNIKERSQRLCQCISRIKEREALHEIDILQLVNQTIYNEKEVFMKCHYTNYNMNMSVLLDNKSIHSKVFK